MTIDLTDPATIKIVPKGGGIPEIINKADVAAVNGLYRDFSGATPGYDDLIAANSGRAKKAIVTIERMSYPSTGSANFSFDLQDVTNQAGWVISQAGVTQAVTDIQLSL